jgi:hypothetical protein
MTTDRDPIANADQPPEVDVHGGRSGEFPPAPAAAERILEFVSWFGDGEVIGEQYEGDNPTLYARDLEAAAKAAKATPQPVLDFINQRTEYVHAARNSRGDDIDADYYRWQGHMEARRQLAQSLGYTVPYEPGEQTRKASD